MGTSYISQPAKEFCILQFLCRFLELGLLEIFNHFIKVSNLLNNVPDILKNIADDIVDDIRKLIPEVETIAAKYNVTDALLAEVGNSLNMNKVIDEIIPELEKVCSFYNF
jgi:hypothetical protein